MTEEQWERPLTYEERVADLERELEQARVDQAARKLLKTKGIDATPHTLAVQRQLVRAKEKRAQEESDDYARRHGY
jgi:hypothetical protein